MMKPSSHNRRSWGKPFSAFRDGFLEHRFLFNLASGLPQKPRSNFSDGVYPKNLDGVGARSAQAFAKLARTEAVRADHRLRTDDETIRAQSTIFW
jgi:hypothetical protein